ncbi:hypothetical protein Droror1_Dr00027164 [Drosera rotundifolia]
MARQPLPLPRLVGLVHALECDAVFCDDGLGLGMAMMRRFAICDDAAILQDSIKNAECWVQVVRPYVANGYLEEAHRVFDEMLEKDECVFWVVIILAWICKRRCEEVC